jgi:hypothetical protein
VLLIFSRFGLLGRGGPFPGISQHQQPVVLLLPLSSEWSLPLDRRFNPSPPPPPHRSSVDGRTDYGLESTESLPHFLSCTLVAFFLIE